MHYINKVTVSELLTVNSVSLETPFVAIYETSIARTDSKRTGKSGWERLWQGF